MSAQELESKLQRYLGYLAQDEHNVKLLLDIGNCYRLLGVWTEAQQYLDKAKLISGQPFWTEQGVLHMNSQQVASAIEAFQQALAEIDEPPRRLNLGFCLFINKDYEAALEVLNYPEEFSRYDTFFLKARILHHLQRDEEAIALLGQLVSTDQADADVFALLGLLHFDSNQIEEASLFSSRALKLDISHSLGRLVSVLIKTLKKEATIAELEELLVQQPYECRLWFALGTTQMQHMNITAAEQAYSKALELWPNFYDCWISIALCHVFQNKLSQAEQAYTNAIEISDQSAEGWGGLALVHALQNKRLEAERLLDRTLALDAGCFLAVLTQIILANHSNPAQASKLLSEALPEVAAEMELLLNHIVGTSADHGKVVH